MTTKVPPPAKRTLNKLSTVGLAAMARPGSKPGRYSDGGGLYLLVDATRCSWVFISWRDGRKVEFGLGPFPKVGAIEARSKAARLRERLSAGEDGKALIAADKAAKKAARLARSAAVTTDVDRGKPTFAQCVEAHIAAMEAEWRNSKTAAQWRASLTADAAMLSDLPVDEIDVPHILAVLEPIWTKKPETASRVRARIEKVLDSARFRGMRAGENPARWRGHLQYALPKRQKLTRGHHAAAPYAEAPTLYARFSGLPGVAAQALRFTILTAARSGETRGATWGEIDFAARSWTVPAERMKAGREHRVPLSDAAIDLLETIRPENASADGLVFAAPRSGAALSDMTMSAVLRRQKLALTVHGFRSTFRDWASETTGFPHDVCEMALAHTIANKAEAAYRRGDLFDKRRKLMARWAEFCLSAETSQESQESWIETLVG